MRINDASGFRTYESSKRPIAEDFAEIGYKSAQDMRTAHEAFFTYWQDLIEHKPEKYQAEKEALDSAFLNEAQTRLRIPFAPEPTTLRYFAQCFYNASNIPIEVQKHYWKEIMSQLNKFKNEFGNEEFTQRYDEVLKKFACDSCFKPWMRMHFSDVIVSETALKNIILEHQNKNANQDDDIAVLARTLENMDFLAAKQAKSTTEYINDASKIMNAPMNQLRGNNIWWIIKDSYNFQSNRENPPFPNRAFVQNTESRQAR